MLSIVTMNVIILSAIMLSIVLLIVVALQTWLNGKVKRIFHTDQGRPTFKRCIFKVYSQVKQEGYEIFQKLNFYEKKRCHDNNEAPAG